VGRTPSSPTAKTRGFNYSTELAKRQWTGAKDAQTTGRVFCVDADSDGFLYVGIRRADYDTEHTGVLKLDRDWNIVASRGFGKAGDPIC